MNAAVVLHGACVEVLQKMDKLGECERSGVGNLQA